MCQIVLKCCFGIGLKRTIDSFLLFGELVLQLCIHAKHLHLQYTVQNDYFAPLDANGKRIDLDQHPELTKGSVEFVAPAEYMVRPPMPPLYFFLIDVSISAVKNGTLEVRIFFLSSLELISVMVLNMIVHGLYFVHLV